MLTFYNVEKPDCFIEPNIIKQFSIGDGAVDDEITKKILADVEQAAYYSDTHYLDRFGSKVSIDNLSLGTMALLLATHTDNIICFDECGENAIAEAINLSCECDMKIYVSYSIDDNKIPFNCDKVSVKYNDVYYDDVEDLLHGGLCYDIYCMEKGNKY